MQTAPAPDVDRLIMDGKVRQRRRTVARVGVAAALAVLVAGGAYGVTKIDHGTADPGPAGPVPDPARGLLALTADPFETGIDGLPLRPGIPPEALWTCISSPLTWGAVESRGATFGRPGHQEHERVYNEFLLRYDSVADAHRAVADALRQAAHSCGPGTDDPFPVPAPSSRWPRVHEFFAVEWIYGPGMWDLYSLRVGREANVVVVLEEMGDSDDRPDYHLHAALQAAVRAR
jgi:hypothetical protein